MRILNLSAEACQPLNIANRKAGGYVLAGIDHVPGSTLRGSLAGMLARMMPEDDPFFREAIVHERMACSSLTPLPAKGEAVWSGPVPRSALTCKHAGEDHLLVDHLFRGAMLDDCPAPALADYRRVFAVCPQCEARLKRPAGFLAKAAARYQLAKPAYRQLTGTAIDSRRESVRDGQLYAMSVLAEGNRFHGRVFLPDDLAPETLTGIDRVRVGVAKSRGLGLLELAWHEDKTAEIAPLEERVDRLTALAKGLGLPVGDSRRLVTLDLQSPLVLDDDLLNPCFTLEPADLAAHGKAVRWQLLPGHVTLTTIGGWQVLVDRPKRHHQALAAGSVIPAWVEGSREDVIAALQSIETHGLGRGWGEGYGQVIVCHPFHIDAFPEKRGGTP